MSISDTNGLAVQLGGCAVMIVLVNYRESGRGGEESYMDARARRVAAMSCIMKSCIRYCILVTIWDLER